MSTNPYEAPRFPNVGPTGDGSGVYDAAYVRRVVSGPATAMLILACVWAVLLVLVIVWDSFLLSSGRLDNVNRNVLGQTDQDQVTFRRGTAVGLLLLNVLTIVGSVKMKRLQSVGWARTAAIISIIPCTSTCYFVGVPFGIWALVVLNRPEVKREFG